jgi:hypothetical protein
LHNTSKSLIWRIAFWWNASYGTAKILWESFGYGDKRGESSFLVRGNTSLDNVEVENLPACI